MRHRSSFTLFILFCLAPLSHGWKRLEFNLTCSDESLLVFSLARNQLSIARNKESDFNAWMLLSKKFPSPAVLFTFHSPIELIQFVTFINLEHFIQVIKSGFLPSPCGDLMECNSSLTSACPLLGKVNFTNAWRGLMPSFTSLIRIMACHKF